MILWQKEAGAAWLAEHETWLVAFAGENLAIISRPGRARTLVQILCPRRVMAEKLVRRFGGTSASLPHDWLESFQSQAAHPPIRIGRRLEVASEPDPENSGGRLFIPAAGAFGTGEHSTTAMSLRLLEETTRNLSPGWRLLDAGTGTGILALAACRFGARDVLGLDFDPCAIRHARQNARANHISRAKFLVADVLRWKPDLRYDLITANLFSELLVAALPTFRRALRAKHPMIISGILREQADSVVEALNRSGFEMETQRRRGKWIALRACRKT
ncbi:MAG TPA: 50S ribosomal protein L11 methyltransferase [Chthoniobacterales bacterium]